MTTRMATALAIALALWGCDDDEAATERPKAADAASHDGSAGKHPATESTSKNFAQQKKWFVPNGPKLAIVPGKGIGPIQLGASVETIERHMDLACQDKTDSVCRYVTRAVELMLKDEKVTRIVVHRMGRPAGPDRSGNPRTYGIFNGALPPAHVRPGMLKAAAIKDLPKPVRVEQVEDDRGFGTVEVHHHPGLQLEFDEVKGKGRVLGAIVIVPSDGGEAAGKSAKPAAPKAPPTGQ